MAPSKLCVYLLFCYQRDFTAELSMNLIYIMVYHILQYFKHTSLGTTTSSYMLSYSPCKLYCEMQLLHLVTMDKIIELHCSWLRAHILLGPGWQQVPERVRDFLAQGRARGLGS